MLNEKNAGSQAGESLVATAWPYLVAGLVASIYSESAKSELLVSFLLLVALLLFAPGKVQMQPADWCVVFMGLYEVPALMFSQYRANSISTTRVIAIAVLFYFAVSLAIRTRTQIVWLSGVFALPGSGLSVLGLVRFSDNSKRLKDAGFTNLLAFRSRLISPLPPWLPG
jgi:hypothetical protein